MKGRKKRSPSYAPSDTLLSYFKDKLAIERKKQQYQNNGTQIPGELEKEIAANNRRKVYVLDEIIFPSMANIVTLFEYVSKNPELQSSLDDDIKELLLGSKNSDAMIFRRLIESIITWQYLQDSSKKRKQSSSYNFRMQFYYTLAYLMFHHLPLVLKKDMPPVVINHSIKNDLVRVLGWTSLINLKTEEFHNEDASRPVLF